MNRLPQPAWHARQRRSIRQTINLEIPVYGKHLPDTQAFGGGHQRRIGQIHGPILIFLHQHRHAVNFRRRQFMQPDLTARLPAPQRRLSWIPARPKQQIHGLRPTGPRGQQRRGGPLAHCRFTPLMMRIVAIDQRHQRPGIRQHGPDAHHGRWADKPSAKRSPHRSDHASGEPSTAPIPSASKSNSVASRTGVASSTPNRSRNVSSASRSTAIPRCCAAFARTPSKSAGIVSVIIALAPTRRASSPPILNKLAGVTPAARHSPACWPSTLSGIRRKWRRSGWSGNVINHPLGTVTMNWQQSRDLKSTAL